MLGAWGPLSPGVSEVPASQSPEAPQASINNPRLTHILALDSSFSEASCPRAPSD